MKLACAIVLFVALSAACSTPSFATDQSDPLKEDQFVRLGRERSQFGDKPNSGIWKHVWTSHFGGTRILFPVGKSDVRYYWTRENPVQSPEKFRLCRESKRRGKIYLDWMIHLAESDSPFKFPKAGTLWKYACSGCRPVGRIPKEAIPDLESNALLAGYRFSGEPIAPYYWIVHSDGQESEWLLDWSDTEKDYYTLPKTEVPYPIAEEEKKFILSGNRVR